MVHSVHDRKDQQVPTSPKKAPETPQMKDRRLAKAADYRAKLEEQYGRKLKPGEIVSLKARPDEVFERMQAGDPLAKIAEPQLREVETPGSSPTVVINQVTEQAVGRAIADLPLVVRHELNGGVETQNVMVVDLWAIREMASQARYATASQLIAELNTYRRSDLTTRTIKELFEIAGEALGV